VSTGPQPYYADEQITLWHGDALETLQQLPDGSVDCCVTSPPYFGLRDYGVEGQYGLEASPAAYVETMRALFGEVRRVLADDGTLWLNLGDSYSGSWGNQGRKDERGTQRPINGPMMTPVHDGRYPTTGSNTGAVKPGAPPAKNLMGIPWRVGFALQDDGWTLRNAVIWSKPNAMPESVTDRLSTRYEHVFLFSKNRRYWFDLDQIREPLAYPDAADGTRVFGGSNKAAELTTGSSARRTGSAYRAKSPGRGLTEWSANAPLGQPQMASGPDGVGNHPAGRNPGDVWSIPTQPFASAHFAVMPLTLAERCILAGCKPGGVVLDPFSGSGTTGLAAGKHGRRYVGIDLNREYLDLSLRTRLAQSALLDTDVPA
jgi:site-specific DNA-methyltransferase (cytosine-N4-specific)